MSVDRLSHLVVIGYSTGMAVVAALCALAPVV